MHTKIKCYLFAIRQNDPYSAIGFASVYQLDQISPTFTANLKIIALAKMRKATQAFHECELIAECDANRFTNEGCFFPYTVNFFVAIKAKVHETIFIIRYVFLAQKSRNYGE